MTHVQPCWQLKIGLGVKTTNFGISDILRVTDKDQRPLRKHYTYPVQLAVGKGEGGGVHELLRKSPCLVRIRENTDQKNSEYGHLFCTILNHLFDASCIE